MSFGIEDDSDSAIDLLHLTMSAITCWPRAQCHCHEALTCELAAHGSLVVEMPPSRSGYHSHSGTLEIDHETMPARVILNQAIIRHPLSF